VWLCQLILTKSSRCYTKIIHFPQYASSMQAKSYVDQVANKYCDKPYDTAQVELNNFDTCITKE